ncbi:gamma-glutamyltransferase family protein [Candidatus Poribacteria bacterium]
MGGDRDGLFEDRLWSDSGPNSETADAGLEILKAGGNAFDAIVAAAFTEAVVGLSNNGIGGYGGCLVGYSIAENGVVAVDYNSRAPGKASEDMFPIEYAEDGVSYTVPGHIHAHGALSVGVPGVVGGLTLAQERFGVLDLPKVMEPAIQIAQDGVLIGDGMANTIANREDTFKNDFPDTARLLMPNGQPPKAGERLRFPELADTLTQIAADGADAFYRGETADKIVACLKRQGGIMEKEDLANYEARAVKSLEISYRDYRLYTPPLCSGGLTTFQMLRVLDGFDLSGMQPGDPELYHLFIEVMKVCWRERLTKLGDPDFVSIDQEAELDDQRIEVLRERVRTGLQNPEPGELIAPEPLGCTIHICAADASGNIVSLTQTHGGGFGSLVAVPDAGFILGHGVGRFDPRPGWANSVGPGKQPLHNMCPTLILKDGRPFASIGTVGGRTIVNCVMQFAVLLTDFGCSIDEALAAPRINCQTVEPLQIEKRAGENALERVRELGHEVNESLRIGGPAHGIVTGNTAGEYHGATDPRGGGKVAVG